MHKYPIIDLHCDLLGCVEDNLALNFHSRETRCSLPQLTEGGIDTQVLAVAAISGKDSAQKGLNQLELFEELKKMKGPKFRLAVENASALLDEDEPLALFFERLNQVENPLYVSLTWNHENRFGGGNMSEVGLKNDGVAVLEALAEKGIAIDFSHTSDTLAWDILNTIERKNLPLKVMASHSNFRSIQDVPRNLPDEIAKEIIRRGGIIGVNFIRRFVGAQKEDLLRHFEHGLSLGGEDALCFGSDFYGGINVSIPGIDNEPFFADFSDASKFQKIVHMLSLSLDSKQIEKICSANYRFFI